MLVGNADILPLRRRTCGELGREQFAAVPNSGDIPYRLERRYLETVLPDGGVIGVSRAPRRVIWKDPCFPCGRGDYPCRLSGKYEPGRRAEPEEARVLIQLCDAETFLLSVSPADNVEVFIG